MFSSSIKSHSDLIFFLCMYALHSFLLISDKISTRLNNKVDIVLKLSIKFSFYLVVLQLSCSFLIGTEKVTYFLIFSPTQPNWPPNSSANYSIIKWVSYPALWITTGTSLGTLYFKSQILWTAPLNVLVCLQ